MAAIQGLFDALADSARTFFYSDASTGLRAILCIDDLRLGPAAGGIRTRRYASDGEALGDARRLAAAMTRKCALAGLDAGGAKTVVLADALRDREGAFRVLGERIEELGGMYRCAGDLGTGPEDLAAVASTTRYAHTDEARLADAVARGLVGCIEACGAHRGHGLGSLRIGVQGCGAIGGAVARRLAGAGAELVLSDLDGGRATLLAEELGASVSDPDALLAQDVDVLAPCAVGELVGAPEVQAMHAWALCGAANNVLRDESVADALFAAGILHVPDELASAGAVVDGIARSVMGLDPAPLMDALGTRARSLLAASETEGRPPLVLAREWARARLEGRR